MKSLLRSATNKLAEIRAQIRGIIPDFENLLHHIESIDNEEEIHHCYVFDHKGNLFEQGHLVVSDGSVTINGGPVEDGTYHVITGLEPTQDSCWSDEQAIENGIRPKHMFTGMTFEEKAKEW